MIELSSPKAKAYLSRSDWSFPQNWRRWSRIVVLSPHSDDAALSLAAHLFYLTQAGKESSLVTCFSVSDFAPFATWCNVTDTTRIRKAEDTRYAATLGPACRPMWLDFWDAPLRGYRLQDLRREHKFTRKEHNLAREILHRLDSILIPGCMVFAPLGIGSHIDHRIVREVGVLVAKSGRWDTLFYEDMPYAVRENERSIRRIVTALHTNLGGRVSSFQCQVESVLEIKTLAANCYPSQVPPERILEMLGRGTPSVRCQSERVWQFSQQEFACKKEDSLMTSDFQSAGSFR